MNKSPPEICSTDCDYMSGNTQCTFENGLKRTPPEGRDCLYSKTRQNNNVHKHDQSEQPYYKFTRRF